MTAIVTGQLTDAHGELSDRLRGTHEGMAHIAGTGPDGKTCRECRFWGLPKRVYVVDARGFVETGQADFRYRAKGGDLCPRRCAEFRRLMRACLGYASVGRTVPHDAAACRHFAQAENPPPVVRPPRPLKVKP